MASPVISCSFAEHFISFKTEAAQTLLVAFDNQMWLNISFQHIEIGFLFTLAHEIADEMDSVGGEILGGLN